MRFAVLALTLIGQVAATAPLDVSRYTASKPALVCDLDLGRLKGQFRRLAWSDDGAYIYLQTIEGGDTARDYIVSLTDRTVSVAFGEPEWASAYWAMKSNLAAPGNPALRIELAREDRRTRVTPFLGGTGAGNGAFTPDPKNSADAYAFDTTLWLLGWRIGEWTNGDPFAGENFSWGPVGSGAILFINDGMLTLMDQFKHRTKIAPAKGMTLPAWSSDGRRIAFLEKTGRRTYRLMVMAVIES
jgi:WD40 repeat protein